MKEIRKICHYSIANPATVFDEDSLTVLQLCGRLAAQLNGCIDIIEELQNYIDTGKDFVDDAVREKITEMLTSGELKFGIYPSGDETGKTDRAVIQTMLDNVGVVNLAEGSFYIDKPIMLHPGDVINGSGNVNTVIYSKDTSGMSIFRINEGDHLTMKDFRVVGNGIQDGFALIGTTTAPYTGARYSYFENVDIAECGTGVKLKGAWCAHFEHCRFDCVAAGVYQQGSCHNNVYSHCSFLGLKPDTAKGIFIDATDGAQNCGCAINDCDFERLHTAVHAVSAVGLSVKNIYAEGVEKVFYLDSCPGFSCYGGYATYIGMLAHVQNSNAADLYKNGRGEIRNVFCTVKIEEDSTQNFTYLVAARDPVQYDMRLSNINAKPASGDFDIYYYDRDINQAYGAGSHYRKYHVDVTTSTLTASSVTTPAIVNVPLPAMGDNEHAKIVDIKVALNAAKTPTTSGALTIYQTRGENTPTIASLYYTAGQAYTAADYRDCSRNVAYPEQPTNRNNLQLTVSNATGMQTAFKLRFVIAIGEMLAYRKAE